MFRNNIGRFLIGLVLGINLHCAISFIINPQRYLIAYELVGSPGEAAIRGFGILFLMWNIPYIFALINPIKNWISLIEAIIMQAVGIFGEAFILINIPPQHLLLNISIQRFLIFDTAGLICLVSAALILQKNRSKIPFDN
jgi:hypothetical protein